MIIMSIYFTSLARRLPPATDRPSPAADESLPGVSSASAVAAAKPHVAPGDDIQVLKAVLPPSPVKWMPLLTRLIPSSAMVGALLK